MRAALLFFVIAACNPYDPNLGAAPFLCGTDEPRCPDGYTPVDVSTIRCECRSSVSLPDAGPTYACNVDENEPNDNYQMPTPTLIGTNTSQNFRDLAICPATDLDHFGISVPTAGSLITVTATFDVARQPPIIDILFVPGGVSQHPTISSPQAGQIAATLSATLAGSYVVRISGTDPVNYSLRIQLAPPS